MRAGQPARYAVVVTRAAGWIVGFLTTRIPLGLPCR